MKIYDKNLCQDSQYLVVSRFNKGKDDWIGESINENDEENNVNCCHYRGYQST